MKKLIFQEDYTSVFTHDDLPRLLSITHISDNPNWMYHTHSHADHCEFSLITGGHGLYTIDNVRYELYAGDIAVVNRDTLHAEMSDPNDPLQAWGCSVTDLSLQGLERDMLLPKDAAPVFSAGEYAGRLQQGFELIAASHIDQEPDCGQLSNLQIASMILLVLRAARHHWNGYTVAMHDTVKEIKTYIDLHFRDALSLELLARQFHQSPSFISHAMTKEYGIAPIKYLIRRRLGEAQQLLVSTDLTVTDIAHEVGYQDERYFCKLFFQKTGVTPLDFRKKYVIVAPAEEALPEQ